MDGRAIGETRDSYPPTGADVDEFRCDGIVRLRGVFDAVEVEGLRAAVAWTMANPGPWAMNFVGDKTKPAFFGDVFGWTRNPAYRDLCINRYAAGIAGRLMGASSVRFYFDHLPVKEPGSAAPARAVAPLHRRGHRPRPAARNAAHHDRGDEAPRPAHEDRRSLFGRGVSAAVGKERRASITPA